MPKEQKGGLVMTQEQFVRLNRIAAGLEGLAFGMEAQDRPGVNFILGLSEGIDMTLRDITEEAEKRRGNHEQTSDQG
jgi:hypothetical protein